MKPLLGIAGFLLALAFIPLRNAMMSPPDDYWFQARVVDQDEPVLVKFGADWCPPCVAMDPETCPAEIALFREAARRQN
ncbi:thioredoxin family protein [Thalassoglobus neptunius]|uniref:thioredoxin family protein n=1 Tax=Thalassoglobus neptunius TaxID=1938619 RepID=UPI001E5186F7|nr:thioredoxin family protein [Thalassoglobus neptunius]